MKEREPEDVDEDLELEQSDMDSSSELKPEPVEDTSVKSHAALRKDRKRAYKTANGGDGDAHDIPINENLKKSSEPQSAPRQNSVWVGNLAYKTTQESLRKFFDGVGEITRIHLPTKNVGLGGKKFKVQGDNMG